MNRNTTSIPYNSRRNIFLFLISLGFSCILSSSFAFGQHSMQLNGDGTHLRIKSHPLLALNEFTIECWLMITGEGTAIRTSLNNEFSIPILSRGIEEDETGSFINYYLGLRKADNVLVAEIELAQSAGVPGFNYFIHGYTPLKANVWYHIAFTFDLNELKIYLNGNLESSMEAPYTPTSESTSDFGIGAVYSTSGSSSGQLVGAVDELRIWNSARTREEIFGTMNSEMESMAGNLVLRLGLNEGAGTSLSYLSAQSLNISLEGSNFEWQEGAPFNAMQAPLCDKEPILRIGVMADPQYCDCNPFNTRFYRETLWKLPEAIEEFNKEKVDFVVTLGDVIDKYPDSYDSVLHFYDALTMPNFKAMGNHEFSDIPDSMKDSIIKLLNMPYYYYDTVYSNYRFIFVDGTEMGLYSRAVHPEIEEEADSIWNEIQGEPKAQTWNGGIGRTQRNWIEKRIQLAQQLGQPVILMGHHQIYPDSTIGNMWNDVQLTELFEKYPNVLAYINGHNHWGDKGLKNGNQYLTHKGMVETETANAFSVLEIYKDKFELTGYGAQESMVFKVRKLDTIYTSIELNSAGISYTSDSGDFVGTITNGAEVALNYFLQPASAENDNEYFHLEGSNFQLLKDTLPLHKSEFKLEVKALSCGFDTIENEMFLYFDTLALNSLKQLPDTSLQIQHSGDFAALDSLVQDKSEFGIIYFTSSEDSNVVVSSIENNVLSLIPKSVGTCQVYYYAFDPYSGQGLSDTFKVEIKDTLNTEPIAIHSGDTLLLQLSDASAFVAWESIFYDADGDSLEIMEESFCKELASFSWVDSGFTLRPLEAGICSLIFYANDGRGGEANSLLSLQVNAPPQLLVPINDTSLLPGEQISWYLSEHFFDTDPLVFSFSIQDSVIEPELLGDQLTVIATETGVSNIHVFVNDLYGGTDSVQWIVTVPDTSSGLVITSTNFAEIPTSLSVYPIPARGNISIAYSLAGSQHIELSILDLTGRLVMKLNNGVQLAGTHQQSIDCTKLKSGIYILKLKTDSGSISKKILLDE